MLYRFTGAYPMLYPQFPGADGKSLYAQPGQVVDFPDGPPDQVHWIPAGDAPQPEAHSFHDAEPQPDPAAVPESAA